MVVLFVLMSFLGMAGMVLVLRGVGPTLSNRYGIKGHNYVALLQASEMSVGLHCKNLTLGI